MTLQDRLQHLEWFVGTNQLETNLIDYVDKVQIKLAQVAISNVEIDHFLSLYLLSDLQFPPLDQEFKKQVVLAAEDDLMDYFQRATELEAVKEIIDLDIGALDIKTLTNIQIDLQQSFQKADQSLVKFGDLVSEYQKTVTVVSEMFSLFNNVISEIEASLAKIEKRENSKLT